MHEINRKWRRLTGRQNKRTKQLRNVRKPTVAAKKQTPPLDHGDKSPVLVPSESTTKRPRDTSGEKPAPKHPAVSSSATANPNLDAQPDVPRPVSASRRKIDEAEEILPLSSVIHAKDNDYIGEFIVVSKSLLIKTFSNIKCATCKNKSMTVRFVEKQGFAEKILVQCAVCEDVVLDQWTSDRIQTKDSTRPPFTINRTVTEAFLSIGCGHAGIETFCMYMGMQSMTRQSFDSHVKSLVKDLKAFRDKVLEEAAKITREYYESADPSLKGQKTIDAYVSYDGSWQKRGFTSLYGLGAVIDVNTGLVLDYELLSKFCYACIMAEKNYGEGSDMYKTWYEEHFASGTCNTNYDGSSKKMETEAASRLWERSVEETGFRYSTVLSDGDCSSFSRLQEDDPYDGIEIQKEECLNHVAKRLRTGLHEIVKKASVMKITLGGKGEGQLTGKVMEKLQHYYRLAIEKNRDSTKNMRNAIYATVYHCASTDSKPNHRLCPKGKNSWCFFNNAKANGTIPKSHKDMSLKLNSKVVPHILPLYKRLSEDKLLER